MILTADNGSYRGISALTEIASWGKSPAQNLTARERLVLQGFDCELPDLKAGLDRATRHVKSLFTARSKKWLPH